MQIGAGRHETENIMPLRSATSVRHRKPEGRPD